MKSVKEPFTPDEIVKMRRAMAGVIGIKREYDFWHNIVLKTPESEFIIDD